MRFVAPALLLVAAAGFGWIAASPWLGKETSPTAAIVTAAADAAPYAAPPPKPEPSDLTPFSDRPLFSAARRPPPPEAPGQPLEDPTADLLFGKFEIAGVVMLGEKAVAMLRDARDGRLLRIRPGDKVEDAEVTSITLESLTFLRAGVTVIAPVEGTGTQ